MQEYKVYVTETLVRPVWVTAETPAEAERIAEENYDASEVTEVSFEADPMSRRRI
jgi:hypothetical protein